MDYAALYACREYGDVVGAGRGVCWVFTAAAGEAKNRDERKGQDQSEVATDAADADEQSQWQERSGPDEVSTGS